MFKNPVEVKLLTEDTTFGHEVHVSSDSVARAQALVTQIEKSTTKCLIVGGLVTTASQILIHLAKTKI